MSIIARLGVWLGLNSTEFVKGLDDATKKTKEFEIANKKRLKEAEKAMQDMMAAAGMAAAGFTAFAAAMSKTFEKADQISDMAKGFDMTIESLLAAQQALQQSGGEADNLSTMLQKLAGAQDGAKEGTDAMRESFARLGIKASEVEDLKIDDLFKRVATALAGVEDAGQRAAIAQDLLGKSVKGVSWSDFVSKYSQFKDPALVAAIEKNAQAWEDIEKAIKDISMLMQKVSTPIAGMVSDTTKIANNINVIFKSFEINMPNFLKYEKIFRAVFAPFLMLPDVLEKLEKITGKLKPEEAANIGMSGFPVNEDIGTDNSYSKKSAKDLAAGKAAQSLAQKLRSEIVKANAEYANRLEILKESLGIQENDLLLENKKYESSADYFELAKKELKHSQDLSKLQNERIREIRSAKAEFEAAPNKEKNQELLNKKIENINLYYDAAIDGERNLYELSYKNSLKEIAFRNKYLDEDLKNQFDREKTNIEMRRDASLNLLDLDSRAYKMRQNDYDLAKLRITAAQELADIETRYAEKRKEIQTEFERTGKQKRDIELKDFKIKQIDELQTAEVMALTKIDKKRQDNLLADIERQQSWWAGWDEAFKNYTEASEKASSQGAAAFQMVASQMEGAIRKFVDTGKLAFGDFVGSVLKNLMYMELRAQATSIFKMLWGSISASFGAGAAAPSGVAGAQGAGFGGFASGGYIDSPSIVGENGAELFIPNTPGTIIPNGSWQQMAASGGNSGLTVNGNYIANMSAIDTQSATQFLAKNKSTIWAAYQSANRSVPLSR